MVGDAPAAESRVELSPPADPVSTAYCQIQINQPGGFMDMEIVANPIGSPRRWTLRLRENSPGNVDLTAFWPGGSASYPATPVPVTGFYLIRIELVFNAYNDINGSYIVNGITFHKQDNVDQGPNYDVLTWCGSWFNFINVGSGGSGVVEWDDFDGGFT